MFDLLNQYFPYLFMFGFAYACGLSVRKISTWLDLAMDYGNVLWWVRYSIVWLFAKETDHFNRDFYIAKTSDVDKRVSNVDKVYRDYARIPSKLWLCPVCFGTWLLFAFTLAFYSVGGMDWSQYWIFLVFSFTGFIKE